MRKLLKSIYLIMFCMSILFIQSCNKKELFSSWNYESISYFKVDYDNINNTSLIEELNDIKKISKIIKGSKEKIVKFKANLTLTSEDKNGNEKSFLINKNHFKTNGITYICEQDLEDLIRGILNN